MMQRAGCAPAQRVLRAGRALGGQRAGVRAGSARRAALGGELGAPTYYRVGEVVEVSTDGAEWRTGVVCMHWRRRDGELFTLVQLQGRLFPGRWRHLRKAQPPGCTYNGPWRADY
eukprot:TRINITY_DN36057_c0_g1_i1.p2 TRINITY_DN36057_c0_g1~~TRINITY_DN36057_c0_g1_i1.p2  ORF type:complete len:115 (+),score=28.57 TRINITY_DN36057_c0_g1_i1:73-417(+)